MNTKLLAMNCALALTLVACGGDDPEVDAGTDTGGEVTDTGGVEVDAPVAAGCGTDGLRCLTIGADHMGTPNMACLGQETAPMGDDREISFNLIKRGLSSTDITGPVEIWTNNIIGADCAAAGDDCFVLDETMAANAMGTVSGGWYAYSADANATANTFATVGYNRPPAAAGGTDTITTIDAAVFASAINLIRSGLARDVEDGILLGDAADCDGEALEGVTSKIFDNTGTELAPGTAPNDMGLAYRSDGALPNPSFLTTDESGGYAAANIPIPSDGIVNVVIYGTLEEGGDRQVIGCEQVSVAPNVVTILSLGPSRMDYPAGSVCAMMTAE
jgi:hypothetical protein